MVFSGSLESINHRKADIKDTLLNKVRVLLQPTSLAKGSPKRNETAIPPETADICIPFLKGNSFLGNQDINIGAIVGNNPPTLMPKQVLKINKVVKFGAQALRNGIDIPRIKNRTRTLFLTLPTRRLNGIEDSALKSNIHPTNSPTVPLLT